MPEPKPIGRSWLQGCLLVVAVSCAAAASGEQPTADPAVLRFGDPRPAGPPPAPFADGRFAVAPHETIVCLGQTDMVRLARDGTFESLLTLDAADRKPRMRNMAWEGDTVFEQRRDTSFGSWQEQFTAAGASTVIAWFGQAEIVARPDAAAPERIAAFVAAYEKLLDQSAAVTRRLVLVSPHPFERPPSPQMPDHTGRNAAVAAYSAACAQSQAQARRHGARHRQRDRSPARCDSRRRLHSPAPSGRRPG